MQAVTCRQSRAGSHVQAVMCRQSRVAVPLFVQHMVVTIGEDEVSKKKDQDDQHQIEAQREV